MTPKTAKEPSESQAPTEGSPPGALDAAAAAYHARVRDELGLYQARCDELRAQYAKDVEAAYREQTPALIQQRLDAANAQASQGLCDITKASNDAVVQSLRRYITDLKSAWAEVSVDEVTSAKLAKAGQDLWFIANAANGAFPLAWWVAAGESPC